MKKRNIIIFAVVVSLIGIVFYNNQMNSNYNNMADNDISSNGSDINKYDIDVFFCNLQTKYDGALNDNNQNKLLPTIFQDEQQREQAKNDLERMKEKLANYNYETDEEADKFLDMNYIGQLYQSFGQWDEALLVYNQATQEFSDSNLAWFNLGSYQIGIGNWSSGIKNVNTSITMDTDNILYWRYAIDFYIDKLSINPKDAETLFELSKYYTDGAEDIINQERIYLERINKLEASK